MSKHILVTVPSSVSDDDVQEIVVMIPDILLSLCNISGSTAEVTIIDEQ